MERPDRADAISHRLRWRGSHPGESARTHLAQRHSRSASHRLTAPPTAQPNHRRRSGDGGGGAANPSRTEAARRIPRLRPPALSRRLGISESSRVCESQRPRRRLSDA
jgi:hypothetical protein